MIQIKLQQLPPLSELESVALLDESDITAAVQAWERDPPESEFKLILRAEIYSDASPEFTFDKRTQRYRYKDTGKFVSQEAVNALTAKKVAQVRDDISAIGNLLVQGKISVATWERETANALKTLHVQSYLLGKGGEKQMTQRDYGILGQRLKEQYQYLRGFSQDLLTKQMTEGQFMTRLGLYSQAARGSYERAKAESHNNEGFAWERRVRHAIESCGDCINYASFGWVKIGTLPNPTEECECAVNCKCTKEFAKEKPADFLLMQRHGWLKMNLKQALKR